MDEAAEVDLAVRIRLQVVHTWRLGEVHTWRSTHLKRYKFGFRYTLGEVHTWRLFNGEVQIWCTFGEVHILRGTLCTVVKLHSCSKLANLVIDPNHTMIHVPFCSTMYHHTVTNGY